MHKKTIPEVHLIKPNTLAPKLAQKEFNYLKLQEENLNLSNKLNSLIAERNELYSKINYTNSFIDKINEDYKKMRLENDSMRSYVENANSELEKYEEEKAEIIKSYESKIGNSSRKIEELTNLNEKMKRYIPERDFMRLILSP